ncbi:MAG TPA: tripartite tricarboxylate transporter substrate binding protein [Casimicrobiaceae bacterium]|jgi:tripartite-type tricarboxylate transporter receptor subunit TctC|nr:tripartite tricarboxylate transporter substrate binding protein [Casimicrobiaceae bacterium]
MMRGFAAGLLSVALCACAAGALAQGSSSRSVTLLVGFAPGGGVDATARMLASRLAETLGQAVIVENRPGAGSAIANERVAKAAPDGNTLLFTTPVVAINMALFKKPPLDPLRDLVPVSMVSSTPTVLVVNPSLPVTSVHELIALARAQPGTLNYSSSGVGTTPHLCGELFEQRTGTVMVHIPYNGSGPSLAALIAGNVDASFASLPSVLQHVKTGRLRALATTGDKRSKVLPDVPTMEEAGVKGVEANVWYGVFAPPGTPPEVVNRLANAMVKSVRAPDFVHMLLAHGEEPVASTPEAFRVLLREEIARWSEVTKLAGIQPE